MNKKQNNVIISITQVLVLLLSLIIIINIFFLSKIIRNSIPPAIYISKTDDMQDEQEKNSDKTDEDLSIMKGYKYENISQTDIFFGSLILVNSKSAYSFELLPEKIDKEELISVYDYKTSSYKIKDREVLLNLSVMENLNDMMDEFHKVSGNNSVMVVSGYRSKEDQERVRKDKIKEYGEEQGSLIAGIEGHSEHHTGYALDFTIYTDAGKSLSYDGTGEYEWIENNCHKYGFILRYPEGKTEITGVQYEPWHFRYVGLPHANYIAEKGLTLEEYILILEKHIGPENSLNVTDALGQAYEIYYLPIYDENSKLIVPAELDKEYTLSGDNRSGIIVTIKSF